MRIVGRSYFVRAYFSRASWLDRGASASIIFAAWAGRMARRRRAAAGRATAPGILRGPSLRFPL
eukprot:scaffold12829_cov116-Isochrysis_galbana.AAC.14